MTSLKDKIAEMAGDADITDVSLLISLDKQVRF